MHEFIDPRFGLVFAKTGSLISGTVERCCYRIEVSIRSRIVSEVISTKHRENTIPAKFRKERIWKICLISWHFPFNLSVFRESGDYWRVLCFDQGCGSASFNAVLDPGFHLNANPDPAPHRSDGNLRRPSMTLIWASKAFWNMTSKRIQLSFSLKSRSGRTQLLKIMRIRKPEWGTGIFQCFFLVDLVWSIYNC